MTDKEMLAAEFNASLNGFLKQLDRVREYAANEPHRIPIDNSMSRKAVRKAYAGLRSWAQEIEEMAPALMWCVKKCCDELKRINTEFVRDQNKDRNQL